MVCRQLVFLLDPSFCINTLCFVVRTSGNIPNKGPAGVGAIRFSRRISYYFRSGDVTKLVTKRCPLDKLKNVTTMHCFNGFRQTFCARLLNDNGKLRKNTATDSLFS